MSALCAAVTFAIVNQVAWHPMDDMSAAALTASVRKLRDLLVRLEMVTAAQAAR
jgi:hypothetical protein